MTVVICYPVVRLTRAQGNGGSQQYNSTGNGTDPDTDRAYADADADALCRVHNALPSRTRSIDAVVRSFIHTCTHTHTHTWSNTQRCTRYTLEKTHASMLLLLSLAADIVVAVLLVVPLALEIAD